MFRTVLVAATALALVAPATAQSVRELSGEWSCKMISLVGDPDGDVTLDYRRNGNLGGEFYLEVPDDEGNTIGMRFSISGQWTLTGAAINMSVDDSELIGAWVNGEAVPSEVENELAESLDSELGGIGGDSTIVYIAKHAMVLEEDDTSISCWR